MEQFHATVKDQNVFRISLADLCERRADVEKSMSSLYHLNLGYSVKPERLTIAETVAHGRLLRWLRGVWDYAQKGEFPKSSTFVSVNIRSGVALVFQIYSDSRTNYFAEDIQPGREWNDLSY